MFPGVFFAVLHGSFICMFVYYRCKFTFVAVLIDTMLNHNFHYNLLILCH